MNRAVLLIFVILGSLSWAYVIQLTWLKINHQTIHTIQKY